MSNILRKSDELERNLPVFTCGGYRLAVDVERTRAWYAAQSLPGVTCTCAGCRNFVRAVKLLPDEVKAFFAQLGADPEQPAETSWFPGTREKASGDGWYHICGEILEMVKPDENQIYGEVLRVSDEFDAMFGPECWLLPEDFPKPCFQMDVVFQLPWVLEEENPDLL